MCPGCQIKLVVTSVGGLDMHQCERCGGLWLAAERFESLASEREKRNLALPVAQAGGAPRIKVPITYRPCPVCKKLMNRYNYARISGVILDSCKHHGLWFDHDELRQCLAFIEKGGLDQSRQRELQHLETERRAAEQAKVQAQMSMNMSVPTDTGWGIGNDRLLGSVLMGAAQTLWDLFNDRS